MLAGLIHLSFFLAISQVQWPLARPVIVPADRAVRLPGLPSCALALSWPSGCRSLRAGPCRVAALPESPRPS